MPSEGVRPAVYYKWLKDFVRKAGKKRLRGDAQREANREEVEQLRQGMAAFETTRR